MNAICTCCGAMATLERNMCNVCVGRGHPPRMVVNLASGEKQLKGAINVDLYAPEADIRQDLEVFPWPFHDETVDHIQAHHILEHLPDRLGSQDGRIRFLQECHRILRPGGTLEVACPHGGTPRLAWRNIAHTRVFYPETLQVFDPGSEHHDPSLVYQAGFHLKVVSVRIIRRFKLGRWFNSEYHPKKYLRWSWNVGRPIHIVWTLRKPHAPTEQVGGKKKP